VDSFGVLSQLHRTSDAARPYELVAVEDEDGFPWCSIPRLGRTELACMNEMRPVQADHRPRRIPGSGSSGLADRRIPQWSLPPFDPRSRKKVGGRRQVARHFPPWRERPWRGMVGVGACAPGSLLRWLGPLGRAVRSGRIADGEVRSLETNADRENEPKVGVGAGASRVGSVERDTAELNPPIGRVLLRCDRNPDASEDSFPARESRLAVVALYHGV
jgi:hypothetical protein